MNALKTQRLESLNLPQVSSIIDHLAGTEFRSSNTRDSASCGKARADKLNRDCKIVHAGLVDIQLTIFRANLLV